MQNPFLSERKYSIFYSVAWVVILAVHATILYLAADLTITIALADALVFNLLFAGLGVSVWFTIRFSENRSGQSGEQFLNLAVSGLVMIALWLGAGYLAVYLLVADADYHSFLEASIPWRVLSGIFFYAILVMVYYLHLNAHDRRERIKREHKLRLQVREAEIDRIKAQINPHFLFNSLNSISALIGVQPDEARDMVVKLSSYLRYSLEHNENERVSLRQELDHTVQYLAIEKVRFGERLDFSLAVDDACMDLLLPHMILQPLIENAIKHGVYESTEPVRIELSARCQEAKILITEISNDFDPTMPPRKGKGIGLTHTLNRLKLVYQSDRLMEIEKSENLFTVRLTIPQHLPNESTL